MSVFVLSSRIVFPPAHMAEPTGLLAVGGDLSEERLLCAYRSGIFPWYSTGEPILWWSPDPRLVLYPKALRVPRRLRRLIKQKRFEVTFDRAFQAVIRACAEPRSNENPGTWLVPEMISAYERLHDAGYAHSVEAWAAGEMAGGLYGVSLGGCFFGESMFTRVSNAGKVALVTLARTLGELGFDMIDSQVTTDHMLQYGAKEISRKTYLKQLEASLKKSTLRGRWGKP